MKRNKTDCEQLVSDLKDRTSDAEGRGMMVMHRHEGRDWDSPEACPICKLEKIRQCKEELYQLLDVIAETDAEYVGVILDRLENEG